MTLQHFSQCTKSINLCKLHQNVVHYVHRTFTLECCLLCTESINFCMSDQHVVHYVHRTFTLQCCLLNTEKHTNIMFIKFTEHLLCNVSYTCCSLRSPKDEVFLYFLSETLTCRLSECNIQRSIHTR